MYCVVWEFRVLEGAVPVFVDAYGSDGDWVRLFRRAGGYLGTELLRDSDDPLRFVTMDRWRDAADAQACREELAAEYAVLDARCEQWTVRETKLGEFVVPADRGRAWDASAG